MKPVFAALFLGAALLSAQPPPGDTVEVVRSMLERASPESGEEWAASLLRADAEAVKIEGTTQDGCCGYRCIRMGQFVLSFRWNEPAGKEYYQHDLLKTVVRARRGSEMGALALSTLLKVGCESGVSNPWTPYFRTVIDILDSPPWNTTNTPALIRIRAEAYETWWSMSKAAPNDPMFVDNALQPTEFQRGAENARNSAISEYRRLTRLQPAEPELRERLAQLMEGQDTHQRRWYCFGD